MIVRIWHGYTIPDNAGNYEHILKSEVIEGIKNMNVKGFRKIEVLTRKLEDQIQFTTIMWFDDIESVKQFAGEDHEKCYVPDVARKVLSDFDKISEHHELIYETGPGK